MSAGLTFSSEASLFDIRGPLERLVTRKTYGRGLELATAIGALPRSEDRVLYDFALWVYEVRPGEVPRPHRAERFSHRFAAQVRARCRTSPSKDQR